MIYVLNRVNFYYLNNKNLSLLIYIYIQRRQQKSKKQMNVSNPKQIQIQCCKAIRKTLSQTVFRSVLTKYRNVSNKS